MSLDQSIRENAERLGHTGSHTLAIFVQLLTTGKVKFSFRTFTKRLELADKTQITARQEAILLVEGPDDAHFWAQVAPGKLHILARGGRPAVLKAMSALHTYGEIEGLLAVIDADWDHLDGAQHGLNDLFSTDTRDLETLLLRTDALERTLLSRADHEALAALEQAEGGTVRALLLCRGRLYGRLRWVALRRGDTVQLHRAFITNHVGQGDWRVNEGGLFAALVTAGLTADVQTLEAELHALPVADDWHICRGHDLLALLRIVIMGPLKRDGAKSIGEDDLLRDLTLCALSSGALRATRLFQDLAGWGTQNPAYAFL
jgi:hypothetical protein